MVTACGVCMPMVLMFFRAYQSAVAAAGARPEALSATGFLPGFETMAKQSPPMPVMAGSTTHSTAVAQMAASTALPPLRSISMAASVAAGCDVAHMALRAMTGERPGKWKLRIARLRDGVSEFSDQGFTARRHANACCPCCCFLSRIWQLDQQMMLWRDVQMR